MEKLKGGFKETGCQAVSSIEDALDTVRWGAAAIRLYTYIRKLLRS
jgi:dihydroorotate dehydrogenase